MRASSSQHQDNGVAARQFLVEPLFPILPRVETGHFVEIKKHTLEAELMEHRLNVVGDLLIEARMADENGWHLLLSDRSTSI